MKTTRLWKIMEYMKRHQATIMEHVAGRPIYEFCTGTEKMGGYSRLLSGGTKTTSPIRRRGG